MLGTLAFLNFLNGREKAIVFWTVALFAFAAYKSDGLGSSLLGVLRSIFLTKLAFLFGAAAFYCAVVVLAASKLGLWHTTALKETLYWFFGSGVVLTGSAVEGRDDAEFVKKIVRRAVQSTLIVEFLVGFYVFPLAVELLIVPLVSLFVGMQLVVENDASLASGKEVIDAVLVVFGFGLILWVAVEVATNLHDLLSRENAETFLLVPALTLAFVPFLQFVAWYSKHEMEKMRERFRTDV